MVASDEIRTTKHDKFYSLFTGMGNVKPLSLQCCTSIADEMQFCLKVYPLPTRILRCTCKQEQRLPFEVSRYRLLPYHYSIDHFSDNQAMLCTLCL